MDSTGSQDEPFEGADNPIEEDLCLGELDVDDAFMQEDEDCVGEVDRDRSFEPSVVELTSTAVVFWIYFSYSFMATMVDLVYSF